MIRLTELLAGFASGPAFAPVPEAAARIIRNGFIDTVGTMIAARDEPVVSVVRAYAESRRSNAREASVLLGGERLPAQDAALVNATAAHALDYDDVALGGHPSAVLVPALLAEGEAIGASGAEVVRAYLVGYETWAELISRDADSYHVKGWHPTAVFGTIAAAAAVGSLRRLNPALCSHAIALSASMAAGLVANFGTMTKPLHAGRAAASGIEAVRLAMGGLTAASDAIEHSAGFLRALSPKGNLDLERGAESFGRSLRLLDAGLSIKKYPTCYATHRVIDAVLDLASEHHVHAEDVTSVQAHIGVAQASMLRNHAPQNALAAKFSLEFAVAAALVARAVGRAQLTDAFVNALAVREAMGKVSTSTVESTCPIEPAFAYSDRVRIRLRDGTVLDSGEIRFARGNAQVPIDEDALKTKFLDCVAAAPSVDGKALHLRLTMLGALPDVRQLVSEPALT